MNDKSNRQNILFVVLDACRFDYLNKFSGSYRRLASDNLHFTNAIAPANWSLPTHASLFTGEHPHNHNIYRHNDGFDSLPLIDQLPDVYKSYLISGNSYASDSSGFGKVFDSSIYTKTIDVYPEAALIDQIVSELSSSGYDKKKIPLKALQTSLSDDHTIKSLANFANYFLRYSMWKMEAVTGIPISPDDNGDAYRSNENTKYVKRAMEEKRNSNDQFFIFANYMDTHRPYYPPKEIREVVLNQSISDNELKRLNTDFARPWNFTELAETEPEAIQQEDINTIKKLYRGEILSIDQQLEALVGYLEKSGLLENTLLIITSDHGEMLAEKDEMGQQRIGHGLSVSDHILNVPLVVAHPTLDPKQIEEHVSINNLFHLILGWCSGEIKNTDQVVRCMSSDNGVVLSSSPAREKIKLSKKYPQIPESVIRNFSLVHTVVGYYEGWKVVVESDGTEFAWENGKEKSFESAPSKLVSQVRKALESYPEPNGDDITLNQEELERLEALGYI